MASGIGTVQVKRMKGKVTVATLGKTPRGQSYLRGTVPLSVKSMADKNFKNEMAQAVKDLFA